MAPLSHGLYGTSQGVGWPVAARAGLCQDLVLY